MNADGAGDCRQGDGVHLPVAAPFNLLVTVRMLQRRPTCRVDRWDGERYRRAFVTASGPRLAVVSNRGTTGSPELWLEIHGGAVDDSVRRGLTETIRWMLGRLPPHVRADADRRAGVGSDRGPVIDEFR